MMETRLPLALPRGPTDLFRSVVDGQLMLSWFQRELPALAACPIQVTSCRARAIKSRASLQGSQLRIIYIVGLEGPGGEQWEHTLLGSVPCDASFPGPELLARCAEAGDHPAARPFRRLAAYLGGLQMGLVILPVDPDLPGLAEMTGVNGPALLAPFLPECRRGASVSGAEWNLRRYRPSMRCVLRFAMKLSTADGPVERAVFVKIFHDDRGEALHRNMQAVWEVACRAECLRVPQPLGYDPKRRMLVMSEVQGERSLSHWIKCLEKDEPLPGGVDEARLERCMTVVARALRELQGAGVRPALQRTFVGELAGLRRHLGLLRPGHPQLGLEIEELLSRLEALAIDREALVPAHGGFRHKQILGDDRGLTFLDWDGLCLAHPALDAATFLARLRRGPIDTPGAAPRLEHLAEVFRRAFLGRPPHVSQRDLAVCEVLVLADRALRAFRRPGRGETALRRVRAVLAAAHQLLDGPRTT